MLQVRVIGGGDDRTVTLDGSRLSIGRRADCDLQLPDYSVSRNHATLEKSVRGWSIIDNDSTNGIAISGRATKQGALRDGDRVAIGIFEVIIESGAGAPPPPLPMDVDLASQTLAAATIVRPLSDFTDAFGKGAERFGDESGIRLRKREALEAGYGSEVFAILTRVGRVLIEAPSIPTVLEGLLDVAFDALPVDRGFVFLRAGEEEPLRCAVMRSGTVITLDPTEVPVSQTIIDTVVRERVALSTPDARTDQRLAFGESVHIHQIRAAICAPLWSGDRIIGVLQLDSPDHTDSFTEDDVDLLTALANYGAIAIERLENAERIAFERHVRSRLERYHSPAVIEAVLTDARDQSDAPIRRLAPAEVSVLFADVVGFTRFASNAPPTTVAEIMEHFFEHAVEAIFAAGGTLDKFIGDCVMAFFGAPIAQEDHALRAVQAALAIQRATAAWNRTGVGDALSLPANGLQVRIGINSGPVVVGDLGSRRRVDYTVLGNTVNVAARLESTVARPGDVVIGGETHLRLAGAFETEALGPVAVRGLDQPIPVFRVHDAAKEIPG